MFPPRPRVCVRDAVGTRTRTCSKLARGPPKFGGQMAVLLLLLLWHYTSHGGHWCKDYLSMHDGLPVAHGMHGMHERR